MRLLLAMVGPLLLSAAVWGQQSPKITAGGRAISKCYAELGYPEGYFYDSLKTRKIPSTPAEKCFFGCIYRELGLTSNGSLNVDWSKRIAQILYGRFPDKLAQAISFIEFCGPLVRNIPSECELGYETRKCLILNSDPSFSPPETEINALL